MVIVVMGAAGAGKTTIGRLLASQLGWRFDDADDFHSTEARHKMHAGVPLTDADRTPWLARLREHVAELLSRGEHGVLACSALKNAYRQTLAVNPAQVKVVYLPGSPELLRARLQARRGHFAGPELLPSQLATLEAPRDAVVVDASARPEAIVAQVQRGLGLKKSTLPSK